MKPTLADRPDLGSFALVTYIPEPLSSFVRSLREALPGAENPAAHITLLPPRPLRAAVAPTSHAAQAALDRFEPFRVRLSEVKVFPKTNTFYLAIATGSRILHKLHAALNAGPLAHDEPFDFLPHITLSGSVPANQIPAIRRQASKAWVAHKGRTTFEVNEVVALWQPRDSSPHAWARVWSHRLGGDRHSANAAGSR